MNNIPLQVTAPPQIFQPNSTEKIYRTVLFAQLPLAIWGIFLFGLPALLTVSGSVLGFLLIDMFVNQKKKVGNFLPIQSIVFGLTLGLLLPPGTGFFLGFLGGAGATLIVRWSFGGVQGMWIHPALVGYIFLNMMNYEALERFLTPLWTSQGGTWLKPETIGGYTPLNELVGYSIHGLLVNSPAALSSWASSIGIDQIITPWLNFWILNPLGANIPAGYVAGFFGFVPGMVGGISAVLILGVSVFLLSRNAIHSRIVFWYLTTFCIGIYILGDLPFGGRFFRGDVLFHLLHGNVLFIGFFILSSMTASPTFMGTQRVYSIGGGLLTILFLLFGLGEKAGVFAAVIMGLFLVILEHYLRPARYGQRRKVES